MLNSIGTAVHYADAALIIRLKTMNPALLHKNIIQGINVAMKLSLLVEDLTKEEKDFLLGLNEMVTLMTPNETHLECSYKVTETPAHTLS
jgi:hypothetical protein